MPRHPHVLAAVICMAALPAMSGAQTNPTGTGKQSPSVLAYNLYAVDLNNDGFADIVEDNWDASTGNGVEVQLGRGDGTFKPWVFYPVNNHAAVPTPMATGDFNHDGKADVAVILPGKNQVAVLLGKGDGTFQAPIYSTLALDSGQTFASAPSVAADFNRDGKLDLIAVGEAGSEQKVYVLAGDGAGNFTSAKVISTLPTYDSVQNMELGDFDGDARADVAFTAVNGCTSSGSCTTTVHALFGDGSFGFAETTPYSAYDRIEISSGDLDSDGKSDLVGYDAATAQMIAFYGQADRVFASYSWTIPNIAGQFANGWYGPFQIADFNGDGRMDIVGYLSNSQKGGTDYELYRFLGTGTRGQFTDYWDYAPSSTLGTDPFGTPPVALDVNNDGRPDLVINQPAAASGNNSYPATLFTNVNTTSGGNWGGCIFPNASEGIRLCGPATSSSSTSVTFAAAASSFGLVRKMELWVDGKKMAENFHAWEHNAWFNYTGTFATGTHQATLYAADVDNRLQRVNYTFTVSSSGACAAPSSYGVHVCSPASGSTVSSPVTVQAAAKIAGTLARMEIWVDGVKKYTETTSTAFSTSVALSSGSHRFDIYAVNTAGAKYESTVTATVK